MVNPQNDTSLRNRGEKNGRILFKKAIHLDSLDHGFTQKLFLFVIQHIGNKDFAAEIQIWILRFNNHTVDWIDIRFEMNSLPIRMSVIPNHGIHEAFRKFRLSSAFHVFHRPQLNPFHLE